MLERRLRRENEESENNKDKATEFRFKWLFFVLINLKNYGKIIQKDCKK